MIGGNKYQHIMFFSTFYIVADFIGYASTDKLNLSLYYYIKHINPTNFPPQTYFLLFCDQHEFIMFKSGNFHVKCICIIYSFLKI